MAERDILLMSLVAVADATDEPSCELTVMAGSFLVSGVVVGKKEYLQHTALTRHMVELAKKALTNIPQQPEQPDAEAHDPEYLHLKDARYFSSGDQYPIPEGAGVYVRIRLDQVVGFHFGRLQHRGT